MTAEIERVIAEFASPVGTFSTVISYRSSTKYADGETGLIYYGYRYYQPCVGRWIGRDPLMENGGENLYTFVLNNALNLVDVNGLKAQFSVDEKTCVITVTLNITIYAKDKTTKSKLRWDELKRRIEGSITRYWNGNWNVDGCAVKFVANVSPDKKSTTSVGAEGDNEIEIYDEGRMYRSYVTRSGTGGIWSQGNDDWVYAHEAGHLMGLKDNYHSTRSWYDFWSEESTAADPGHVGHMMGEYWGTVSEHEVSDILKRNKIKCSCKCKKP